MIIQIKLKLIIFLMNKLISINILFIKYTKQNIIKRILTSSFKTF